jgi:hypothetical protein
MARCSTPRPTTPRTTSDLPRPRGSDRPLGARSIRSSQIPEEIPKSIEMLAPVIGAAWG